MDDNNEIIVEVRGGTVQAVYAKAPIAVDVLDWDNYAATDSEEEKAEFLKMEKTAAEMKRVY